jgi:hypothetical protein
MREQRRSDVTKIVDAIKAECATPAGIPYAKQLAVMADPAREVAVLGTRRAGKTELWKRVLVITALERAPCICRIWAISRLRCKELIWLPLIQLLTKHQIKHDTNETELRVTLHNGSEIRLVGADKDKEVQKKRGDKTAVEIVLEAQSFGAHLFGLVEDVAGPCLMDLRGKFYMEGTPGPVCVGYWYDVTGGEDTAQRWTSHGHQGSDPKLKGRGAGWSVHHLDVLSNPFLPHAWEELEEKKRKRNWDETNPTYVREWRGRWVNDFTSLFYSFDPLRNTFLPTPHFHPWGPGWMHTLGWDLGAVDDMALVVWGFHPKRKELYEAFSWKKPGAGMEEVMKQIADLKGRGFNFIRMFADTQGGGRMYVDEVLKRYPYEFEPAKKSEKYAHVMLLNDELRTGFVKLGRGSEYAIEMAALQRSPDWPDPDNPDKPPYEDPRMPNHCCDAGLYAFRGAMHYLHRDDPPAVKPHTAPWYAEQEQKLEKRLSDQRNKSDVPWLEREDQPEDDWLEHDL